MVTMKITIMKIRISFRLYVASSLLPLLAAMPLNAANSVYPQVQAAQMGADVVTVMANQMGATVTLGGTVVPYREVTLTAQIPGRIEFIAGTEGDWFKEKQLLVGINDDDLLAKRRAAIAELNNASSAIQNAQVQYSREMWSPQSRSIARSPGMGMPSMFDQMFTQPFSSAMPGNTGGTPWVDRQADLYSQGHQISQAQGRQMRARSQVEEIDAKIRDARSIAPFEGVVVRKLVEVGDTVQPGQPLLQYADTRYLQVKTEIPARLIAALDKGMMLPVHLDVGDAYVDARVAQIFPVADPQRHTVTVKLDLPEGVPGGPGMYAEVMVPDHNAQVQTLPVIPESAVIWRGSLPAVYVVNNENQTQLRMVRLGDRLSGLRVSVLSGLQVGERIRMRPSAGEASSWAGGRAN
jgi:multidrug efflux pump subunit AcrA (membrane-fusion protein)